MFKGLDKVLEDIEAKEKATAGNDRPGQLKDSPIPTPVNQPTQKRKSEPKKLRQLNGRSILEYAQAEIDHSQTLLGDRYLCRGGGMFIVAPSGQGKSTLAVQLAAEWALGWASLEIRPPYPLRTLIIQAEDDAGDLTEMSRWVKNHYLSSEQMTRILRDTRVELVNDVSGYDFVDTLDEILQQWPCDIVIINPYTSFLGGDAKDEERANNWLRNKLNPVLHKHRCGAIIVHHTPKTQFSPSDDFTTSETQYRGAGCASMTNWARAYLVFEPLRKCENVFLFKAAKRGKRIGWSSSKRHFKHSDDEMRWEACTIEEVKEAEQASRKPSQGVTIIPEVVMQCVSTKPEYYEIVIERIMKTCGVGDNKARKALDLLEAHGRIFYTFLPIENSDAKRGRKRKHVAKPIEAEEFKKEPKQLL